MLHRFRSAPGLLALALMGWSPHAAEAQAVAPGPYYALPAWDMVLPSHSRFIILSTMNSAAVLDRETGLVWERQPSNLPHTWPAADAGCREAAIGGRKGWRLPRLEELQSLIDPAQASPALPPGHPFIFAPPLPGVPAFSSTTVPEDLNLVRLVDLPTGGTFVGVKEGASPQFDTVGMRWCVRGGSAQ